MKRIDDLVSSTVERVTLTAQQYAAQFSLPTDIKVDAHLDFMTESMMVRMSALVWGEKRELLVKVPDGLWEYVKHSVKHWAHTPIFIAKRLNVRYIDWEARVFRAYPDFKAPKLYGPQFDRCVVHTMQPLNLTELSR